MLVLKINNKLESKVIITILILYYILKSIKSFIINNIFYYPGFKINFIFLNKLYCINYPI